MNGTHNTSGVASEFRGLYIPRCFATKPLVPSSICPYTHSRPTTPPSTYNVQQSDKMATIAVHALFFWFTATLLLILVSVSSPRTESISFLNAGTGADRIRFGAFGYTGSNISVGYDFPAVFGGLKSAFLPYFLRSCVLTWDRQRWKAFVSYHKQLDRRSHPPPNRSVVLASTAVFGRVSDIFWYFSCWPFWSCLPLGLLRGFALLLRTATGAFLYWPRLHPHPHCFHHRHGSLGNSQECPQGQRGRRWVG